MLAEKRAVVLLSGGLDSSLVLHLAHEAKYEIHALTLCYGQRHNREIESARWQANSVAATSHRIIDLPLDGWGDSALTHPNMPIEAGDLQRTQTPNTYVPGRNMVFLAIAASLAEAIDADSIWIGVSEADYSGYVDCRSEFIQAMQAAINKGTERRTREGRPIEIIAPLLTHDKAWEVKEALRLGIDLAHTWSCYNGGETPCGTCDSCLLRQRAFQQVGIPDPLTNRD